MRAVLAMLWLTLAAPAAAGPWPRDPGAVFLSLGTLGGEVQAYGEYGLGRGWTTGFDGALAADGGARGLVLFARTLNGNGARVRLAVEGGVGATQAPGGAVRPVLRAGLSAGRGWGGRVPGWATLHTFTEWRGDAAALKTDATLGLRRGRLAAILEAQGDLGAASTLHLAPALAYTLRPGTEVVLGGRFPVLGGGTGALRLSAWISF